MQVAQIIIQFVVFTFLRMIFSFSVEQYFFPEIDVFNNMKKIIVKNLLGSKTDQKIFWFSWMDAKMKTKTLNIQFRR